MGYWMTKMKREASHQITVRHLNLVECGLGKPHHVWKYLSSDAREVMKACIKVKLLLGQYNLQTAKHHTNNTCPLCGREAECETHFILRCPKLQPTRAGYLHLRWLLLREIPDGQVSDIMSSERNLVQAILVCTLLPAVQKSTSSTIKDIEGTSRGLLYSLHLTRQKLLGPCGQKCSKDVVCPRCIILDIDTDISDTEEQYSLGGVELVCASAVLPCAGEEVSRR
jgi:hypothetical protein